MSVNDTPKCNAKSLLPSPLVAPKLLIPLLTNILSAQLMLNINLSFFTEDFSFWDFFLFSFSYSSNNLYVDPSVFFCAILSWKISPP